MNRQADLTQLETQTLMSMIRDLCNAGYGMVYISHQMHEIFELYDDVTILREGHFICESLLNKLSEENLTQKMVG